MPEKMPDRLESLLQRQAADLGLKLEPGRILLMEQHFELLQRWNPAVGLTAARDAAGAAPLYLEAVQVVDLLGTPGGGGLLDLGSGGGFPGMVLAILRPDWSVMLLDRASRKAAFLQEAARELGLRNVKVLEQNLSRPEDLPADLAPEILTSKAMGRFSMTLDLLERRAAPGGRAILFTGERGEAEIQIEIGGRDGRLRLLERRLLPGRMSAVTLVVAKS